MTYRSSGGRHIHPASLLSRRSRRLFITPVLVFGLAAALAGTFLIRGEHSRAQASSTRARALTRHRHPARVRAHPHARSRARHRAPHRPRRAIASADAGHILTVRFYSQALGRVADYLVYLPTGYSPARRLPVFYMLHGMPGKPEAFTVHADIEARLEELVTLHEAKPMILVFPDGRINGLTSTDSEWANTSSGRYESYVVDVVHDVDHRFATLPHRQDRAIAGLSAGAYGAANVGLHRVALFGLMQVWSGYFIQTKSGVFAHATQAALAYNSPLDYVHTMRTALSRYPLRAFIYIGAHDPDRPQTQPMALALRAEGADVQYAIYPGRHSWDLWTLHADRMLSMASGFFALAPSS